jgi:hypothetical protein
MGDAKTLYDQDFVAWSKQQAEALRAAARVGSNLDLDWGNLAEEVESLGISQRSALSSQIRRMIRHFLKLEFSPAAEPRRGWFEAANDAKAEIEHLLEMSPKPENRPRLNYRGGNQARSEARDSGPRTLRRTRQSCRGPDQCQNLCAGADPRRLVPAGAAAPTAMTSWGATGAPRGPI